MEKLLSNKGQAAHGTLSIHWSPTFFQKGQEAELSQYFQESPRLTSCCVTRFLTGQGICLWPRCAAGPLVCLLEPSVWGVLCRDYWLSYLWKMMGQYTSSLRDESLEGAGTWDWAKGLGRTFPSKITPIWVHTHLI